MTKPENPTFVDELSLSSLIDAASGRPPAPHAPPPEPTTPAARQRYLGKWRGIVLINVDPMGQGRIQVSVPDVLGVSPSTWALPCVSITGHLMGTLPVPPIGSSVWVEFEQGDPDHPIWVGSFWDDPTERPGRLSSTATPGVPTVAIETLTSGVVVSDAPITSGESSGTAVVYAAPASTIAVGPAAVSVDAPNVETSGRVEVTISGGRVSISADTELELSAPVVSVSADTVFRVNGQSFTVLGD